MRYLYDGTKLVERMEDYTLFYLLEECDSVSYDVAAREDKWRKGMNNAIEVIRRNNTQELTTLPKGHKPISVKRIYKTKINQNGKVEKYMARLIVKNYIQLEAVDYEEVFAPVARIDTI